MKKTVSININGIFFHIDENAFQVLDNYLETLKHHFTGSEGQDEIISDIEARIAEIFQSRIDDKNQVIRKEDVDEVIGILGKPEDISGNGSTENGSAPSERRKRRRLYRDADNRVLGGVCSGISHYFDVDPIWIRIAFLIALCVFGSSVLIYIALWIIIPPAVSTSDRLEMKGEKINIKTIERNIHEEIEDLKKRYKNRKKSRQPRTREEIEDFKRRMRHLKNEMRYRRHRPVIENGSFGSRLGGIIENLVYYTIKVILVIIGVIFLILGLSLTIALILSLTGSENFFMVTQWGMTTFSLPAFASIIFENHTHTWITLVGLSLLIGVPLLMMVFNGIKLILGYRKKIRIVSITAMCFWLVGLFLTIYASVLIYKSFSQKSNTKMEIGITQPKNNVLYLDLNPSPINLDDYEEVESKLVFNNVYFISDNYVTSNYGLPTLRIIPSDSSDYRIIVLRYAHGNSIPQARKRAEEITYEVYQTDTVLHMENYFTMPLTEKWRNQKVRLTLRVPVGQKIHFNESMLKLFYNEDVTDESWNEDMIGKTMVMTPTGLNYADAGKVSVLVPSTL
jgi:phage shock protein PspC (stress-responsive transcriptional regulator)